MGSVTTNYIPKADSTTTITGLADSAIYDASGGICINRTTALNSGKLTVTGNTWMQNGVATFAGPTTGGSYPNLKTASLLLGPYSQRTGTTGVYMGGIAFDHLLSYSGEGTTTYSSEPHVWIGMRTIDYPGWERSAFIIATRNDTSGTANSTTERMCVYPDGNVGVGTTTPQAKFDVTGGSILARGGSTYTYGAEVKTVDNQGGAAFLWSADNHHGIWMRASVSANGAVATAGDVMTFREYGDFQFWNNGPTMSQRFTIKSDGNIGVGTATPSYKLHVNGTFYSAGSSLEYKQEIFNYYTCTDKIMQLRPVEYMYKEKYKDFGKNLVSGKQIGLIAEEVAQTFPELAVLKEEEGQQIVRNVDYEKLCIVLLSEVQKIRKELNELKTK